MYFLFSGEGSTDMGKGPDNSRICEGEDYKLGPMALIVEQIVSDKHKFSPIKQNRCGFIPKGLLMKKAKNKRPGKKNSTFPGKKKKKETAYFYRTAYAFGILANEESKSRGEPIVAVLFRDSDNRNSSERGEWSDKWESMINGFSNAEFSAGVPMLPKPISEAWLICALKQKRPYKNCDALEKRSPSPRARVSLKKELNDVCRGNSSRSNLCTFVEKRQVDACKINMPSFNAFKNRLLEVI